MTMSTNQSLPKFDAPPVVEMVLGVEFTELLEWNIPHFGLLWGMIRNEYRYCSVKEPLLSQIEIFGDEGKQETTFNFPNHIEPDKGRDALSRLTEILPCWSGSTSGNFLPTVPEVVALRTSYLIPENRGRLHISMQPVFRHADAKELLQMTVSAKVKPISPNVDEVLPSLDLGHEWAVQGFADFTSAKMHNLWKRRQ